MVDFICMGLLDLWGARTENYNMKNSCPQWDSNPGPYAYEANALSVQLSELRADKYRSPEGDQIIGECAIKSYLYCTN